MICSSREFFSLSNALKIIKSFDLGFNGNLIGHNSNFKLIPFDLFSVVRNRVAEKTFIVYSRLHEKLSDPKSSFRIIYHRPRTFLILLIWQIGVIWSEIKMKTNPKAYVMLS